MNELDFSSLNPINVARAFLLINLTENKNEKTNFIEIEAKNKANAIIAAKKFKELKLKIPCLIMLDNIKPKEIKKIIKENKIVTCLAYLSSQLFLQEHQDNLFHRCF